MESNRKKIFLQMQDIPSDVKESINILRGSIQLNENDYKTIAIMSALPNEGKSSVALNLAQSMSRLSKNVLYLDSDIRNSVFRTRYGVEIPTVGLSEFLKGDVCADDIIYNTDNQYMDIVFSGSIVRNPSEIISSPLFRQLLDYLKEKYEYIIVDAPPINIVIDGILIAKQCDTTILVVESGSTDKSYVGQAKKKLVAANINILGAVLNKVGNKDYGYGYGNNYGYGYGYGYSYGNDGSHSNDDSSKKFKRKRRK